MPTVGAGPWPSYQASFQYRLDLALKKADSNPYIKGWRANRLREHIDAFVQRGVQAQFESLSDKDDKVVVHCDFSKIPNPSTTAVSGCVLSLPIADPPDPGPTNILFDEASGCITALIDYDFSWISCPSYEFLRLFDGLGG